MINAIIDFNYILNKCVFSLNKINELDKLKISLNFTLKKIMNNTHYDNFIIAADSSGSWRKRIYPEYKAPRKEKRKKDELDWKVLYEMSNEFKNEFIQETAAKLIEFSGAEGDDIISQFVQKSNLRGDSNIIIASDRDLLQLLEYSNSPEYINVMVNEEYKNSKIYMPVGGEEYLDKLRAKNSKNVFFMAKDNSHFIRYIDEQMAKREVLEIFKEEKLFLKIIAGDGKDNVMSTHYKYNLDKCTKRGIGEKTAEKIYIRYKELHPEPINFKSEDFVIRSKNVIAENRKIKESEVLDVVHERIILNTKLIMLDEKFLPEDVRTKLNNKIYEILL